MVDRSVDGCLALKFVHNVTERDLIVFACYLPPDGSVHGRNAQAFFAHLLTLIYSNSNSDHMFIGADFNARVGNLSEIASDKYNIRTRTVCDNVVNPHGRDFIDFLGNSNFVILNGRFSGDNYTSISRRGKAVVDYQCVPLDMFSSIQSYDVITMQELTDKHVLHGLLGERSRLPDHSLYFLALTWTTRLPVLNSPHPIAQTMCDLTLDVFQQISMKVNSRPPLLST